MSLKLYQNPKMTIEFDVEVVRKNNHLKRLFACRLKLHATSEFRKSWRAEPGVTRQITLSGFIPSAIFSVERIRARGNRASRQGKRGSPRGNRASRQGKRGSPCTTQGSCFHHKVRNDRAWTFDNGSKQDMDKFWKPEDAWMFEHVA